VRQINDTEGKRRNRRHKELGGGKAEERERGKRNEKKSERDKRRKRKEGKRKEA